MPARSIVDPKDRWRSAAIVAAVHLALGYALVSGLGVSVVPRLQEPLALIDLIDEPEPEPAAPMLPERTQELTERPKDPEGAAAPPALRNSPKPIIAPEPVIELPIPPPLAAAPVPGEGTAPAAGAAPIPGPGTGRGGTGEGLGAGRFGSGTGGGGGGGLAREPEYLRGRIDWRDVPAPVLATRPRGTVRFRLLVGRDGRVRDCRVTASSGHRGLDAATCQAAVRRLRYAPARNTAGRPVEAWTVGENEWIPKAPPPDRWYEPEEVRD
ncbi:energy transducer TonB [Sphingomonas sp. GCM10030256]|uniref:energy transducer TonB n=1 Tax=Sphingomonas sp. GCM10030256 TaxID=3273427 RepID=UPI00360D6DCA